MKFWKRKPKISVNEFVSQVVQANIKRVVQDITILRRDMDALINRMDNTEKNVVNNLESAVFFRKLVAAIRLELAQPNYTECDTRTLQQVKDGADFGPP